MIGCYDMRPINEIRDELMGAPMDQIDLTAICIILCERLANLTDEVKTIKNEKKT